MAEFDLRHVTAAVHTRAVVWEKAGVRWNITIGSETDRASVEVACETSRVLADLIVRADGAATMRLISRPAKLTSLFHYHLADAGDVASCLDELTRHLVPSS